jgi:hypothetical protein
LSVASGCLFNSFGFDQSQQNRSFLTFLFRASSEGAKIPFIKDLQAEMSPPTVKQHLAALRMLLDRLVTGHVIDVNPAHAVRGPKYVVKKGKTPVLAADEARTLLDSIPIVKAVAQDGAAVDRPDLVGLRDRGDARKPPASRRRSAIIPSALPASPRILRTVASWKWRSISPIMNRPGRRSCTTGGEMKSLSTR